VKKTVNFDDPGTYHLYYGDGVGTPGTILTFFPWPGARRGRDGAGQTTATAFAVPAGALAYWEDRLREHGVRVAGRIQRFGQEVLPLDDPDGLHLELVETDSAPAVTHWAEGPVPAPYALRGFHGVTLDEVRLGPTDALLTAVLGFANIGPEGDRVRYQAASPGPGAFVDVVASGDPPSGLVAVGTVHHLAWRTPTDASQVAWQTALIDQGLGVSPVLDRQYFHSIYFREPGGVLFEIATDPPGFATDESPARLGQWLKLPPWLEPARAEIEAVLPPLRSPEAAAR
jgi:glyoxalase family protein